MLIFRHYGNDAGTREIEIYKNIAFICMLLYTPPTREPRSLSFFVKDECKTVFPEIWEKHFKDSFIFMTGDEAFESTCFGSGKPHLRAREFFGDYAAIATRDLSIWFRDENGVSPDFIGLHAGLCHDEMLVPLILT